MNEIFPTTPKHKTHQHLKPTGKSRHLRDALNQILQEEIQQADGRKSAVDAILMDGAFELGLIYFVDRRKGFRVYNVCAPEPNQRYSHTVWLQIHEQLQNGVAWSEVVEELLNRPYGLYPSVLELFIATFYRYNRDYLEVYSKSGINNYPIDVTSDTVIDMVESPNKYVVRYQPLTESQCAFLRGLVERALYPRREFEIQRAETASLRNRAAVLLRRWMNGITCIPHQTSPDELAIVLRGVPRDILSLCVMLIEIAFKPEQAMTAADLLDQLPTQVGLPKDSSSWTEVELDRALAYLETACQQLRGFYRTFEVDMAWQIGQLFGLTELSKNLNDALDAALKWRKETAGAVLTTHLAGAPEARDLLQFLDDRPHSFEQVFLNTLASRWVRRPFQEWQEISTRDEYLQHLTRAKSAVEAKAAELPSVSPQKKPVELVDVKSLNVQSVFARAPLPTSLPESKPLVTTTQPAIINNTSRTVEETTIINKPPHVAERRVPDLISQNIANDAVTQAFAEIKMVFSRLSQQDQYALWQRLVEEYDPR